MKKTYGHLESEWNDPVFNTEKTSGNDGSPEIALSLAARSLSRFLASSCAFACATSWFPKAQIFREIPSGFIMVHGNMHTRVREYHTVVDWGSNDFIIINLMVHNGQSHLEMDSDWGYPYLIGA